jgi:hypothetical protein
VRYKLPALTRREIDRRLRSYAGDHPGKIIGWIRSTILTDEEAELVLTKLDRQRQASERAERMRFTASGVIEVDDVNE